MYLKECGIAKTLVEYIFDMIKYRYFYCTCFINAILFHLQQQLATICNKCQSRAECWNYLLSLYIQHYWYFGITVSVHRLQILYRWFRNIGHCISLSTYFFKILIIQSTHVDSIILCWCSIHIYVYGFSPLIK